MLEFLLLTLFSDDTQNFFDQLKHQARPLPQIEVLEPSPVPTKPKDRVAPKLLDDEKVAVIAFDERSGKLLFEKSSSRPQHIASISKIMSFLILIEEHDLASIVTIPEEATKMEGAKIDVYQHERLTMKTLLEAILIPSANDAMVALAIYNAETEDQFVEKMNQKAKELGLDSAQFYNSTGLDIVDEDGGVHGNKMSAKDVLTLARTALQNDFFRETVGKDFFWGISIDERFSHEKPSTNKLFNTFVNSKGVKTGYTELAGECLVNLAEDKDGNQIITVVLGSNDRFQETKNIVSWVWDTFVWR